MRFNSRLIDSSLKLSSALLVSVSFSALSATSARAQQQLPGIVIQGANLESAPARRATVRQSDSATADAPSPEAPATESGGDSGTAADDGISGISAEKIGSSVTVVTGAQLKAQQIRNAGDALRSLPGVSVNRTSNAGSLTQVRIRGAEANHTLVLIDGIEANASTDGEFDFSDLLTEDIERIEVIRGPQSALYGSNAVGGVINIITRSGKGPLTVTTRAEAGSFNTQDGALRISGGNDRAWGAVTVHHQRSDGFNIAPNGPLGEDDGTRLTSFAAKAGFKPAENVQLNLNVRRTTKDIDRDDQTGLDRSGGFVIASDSFSRLSSSVLLMGANLQWDMFDGNLTHVFKATRNLTERDDVLIADFGSGFGPPSRFFNESETSEFGYQATYRFVTPLFLNAKHSLTGLAERERESFELVLGGIVTEERARNSFAAEWRGEFLDRVYLSAGARRDDNDSLDDFTTWRTAVSVPIRELGLRPHASVGTAVKLPTMFEQFGLTSTFVPNPNLKPEESFGWDAGLEFTFLQGRAIFDVTYFDADLENKIASAPVPGPGFRSTVINLEGKGERSGIEVSSRLQVVPGLTVGLGYTYLDAVDSTGKEEIRRPPHSGRADVTYAFDRGRGLVNLTATYNGEMKDIVFGGPVPTTTLDDYWLVTAAASYKLTPTMEVFGRVENLFDVRYQEVFGFDTPGVAAYAGLRFTLEDPSTKDWSRSKE